MIVQNRPRMLRWSRRSPLFRGRGTVAAARSPAPSGAASAHHAPRRLGELRERVAIELDPETRPLRRSRAAVLNELVVRGAPCAAATRTARRAGTRRTACAARPSRDALRRRRRCPSSTRAGRPAGPVPPPSASPPAPPTVHRRVRCRAGRRGRRRMRAGPRTRGASSATRPARSAPATGARVPRSRPGRPTHSGVSRKNTSNGAIASAHRSARSTVVERVLHVHHQRHLRARPQPAPRAPRRRPSCPARAAPCARTGRRTSPRASRR